MIVILIGKSASGKDTLQERLVKAGLSPIVSTTTRPMRNGETEGKEYHFVSDEIFDQMISDRVFLECVSQKTSSGFHRYGSPMVNPKEKDYVVILNPAGAADYLFHYGARNCLIFYLECSTPVRLKRAKERAKGSFSRNEWMDRLALDKERFRDVRELCDVTLNSELPVEVLAGTVTEVLKKYKRKIYE